MKRNPWMKNFLHFSSTMLKQLARLHRLFLLFWITALTVFILLCMQFSIFNHFPSLSSFSKSAQPEAPLANSNDAYEINFTNSYEFNHSKKVSDSRSSIPELDFQNEGRSEKKEMIISRRANSTHSSTNQTKPPNQTEALIKTEPFNKTEPPNETEPLNKTEPSNKTEALNKTEPSNQNKASNQTEASQMHSRNPITLRFNPSHFTLPNASTSLSSPYARLQYDPAKASSSLQLRPSCDLWSGEWVYDESYPLWRSEECLIAGTKLNCKKNGRKDEDYMRFRWKPHGCSIPRLDEKDFRNRLKGKRIVFIGDSLARNQFESLLCLLQKGIDHTTIYEKYNSTITKSANRLIFVFLKHKFKVEYYRSPYLVQFAKKGDNAPRYVKSVIKLDQLDSNWNKTRITNANILIFNAGHWFNPTKTIDSKIYFQMNDEILNFEFDFAFELALRTWAKWANQIDSQKTRIIFRGFSPIHFKSGTWRTGGVCKDVRPNFAISMHEMDKQFRKITLAILSTMDNHPFLFLDIANMSMMRTDAHPGRLLDPLLNRVVMDCSHWCLPGLPDIWNELMYAALVMENKHLSTI